MQTVNEEWWEGPEKKRRTAIGPGIESSTSSRLCTFRLTSTPVFNTVVAAGWDPELGVVPPTGSPYAKSKTITVKSPR